MIRVSFGVDLYFFQMIIKHILEIIPVAMINIIVKKSSLYLEII